jgi:hypothetical protein
MTNSDTRHRVHRSSTEQDRAAGGRDARLVAVDGGAVSRASIELKQYTDKPRDATAELLREIRKAARRG